MLSRGESEREAYGGIHGKAKPATPGRKFPRDELNRKPTEQETSYRSAFYVTDLDSADGNPYRPGEPIPLAEAQRQGLAPLDDAEEEPEAVENEEDIVLAELVQEPLDPDRLAVPEELAMRARTVCPRCHGTKKYGRVKGHRPDCNCPSCQPCPRCKGEGKILLIEVQGDDVPSEPRRGVASRAPATPPDGPEADAEGEDEREAGREMGGAEDLEPETADIPDVDIGSIEPIPLETS